MHPRTLEGEQRARARFDGRDVINLASNNYLGLAAHPRLKEAAAKAAAEFGAGIGRGAARSPARCRCTASWSGGSPRSRARRPR